MELRQLRYFIAVAEDLHVGRASQRLHIAQPALSRQIQKLEQEIGKDLFVRHAKGVSLTADGRAFYERAIHLMGEFNALTEDFVTTRRASAGEVTIASTPAMAEAISLPITVRCAERFSDIRLRIRGAFMQSMADVLLKGETDLAIFNGSPCRGDLTLVPLFREQLCVVSRYDDDRFDGSPVQVSDLRSIPFVVSGLPQSGVRRIVDEALGAAGFSLDVVAETDTVAASSKFVVAGAGPTIHVAGLIANEIREGCFRASPIQGLYMSRLLGYSAKGQLSPAAQAVVGIIRDWASDLLRDGEWLGAEHDPISY